MKWQVASVEQSTYHAYLLKYLEHCHLEIFYLFFSTAQATILSRIRPASCITSQNRAKSEFSKLLLYM